MDEIDRYRWVSENILCHESEVRGWLRRRFSSLRRSDVDDVIQESLSRIWGAKFSTIVNGRAYFFAVVRHVLAEHARRQRVVPIDLIGELEAANLISQDPGPDRLLGARCSTCFVHRAGRLRSSGASPRASPKTRLRCPWA